MTLATPSESSASFRTRFFPECTKSDWGDWRWQLANRFRSMGAISKIIDLSSDEARVTNGRLPVAITPYFASLINTENRFDPIRRTVVPSIHENVRSPYESEDPLAEDDHSPCPGVIHRYPDRVLFLATNFCPTFCRYCTRSRVFRRTAGSFTSAKLWEQSISYIASKPEVRDVLLSGGDPLSMSDAKLEWLLSRLRSIRHVELLRIGTKVPVVLPQRITPELTNMLKKYHPLWISIHFTHPNEITPESEIACNRLADAGIPLGSQTVLLKSINDDEDVMKRLLHGLLTLRVKPYYLYQCDPIVGSAHFRTALKRGIQILEKLRGHTTGYAVPTFVIDAPGGGGKIPLLPEYMVKREGNNVLFKNYRGMEYLYPDVAE